MPRPAAAPAAWALRTYAQSAAWLTVAAAIALAATLTALAAASGLQLPAVPRADLGIAWTSFVRGPAGFQREAIDALSGLVVALAVAIVGLGVLTVITISLARAAARRAELAVRRAVGASRRDLCAAALLEGVVLALAALGVGLAFGVPGHGLAVATWPGGATHGSTGPALVVLVALGGAIVLGAILPAVFAGSGRRGIIVGALPQGLVLPAVQLGVAFTVLVAASQLVRHGHGMTERSGAVADGGDVFSVRAPDLAPAGRGATYVALLRRLGGDSRFDTVSLTSPGVLVGLVTEDLVVPRGGKGSATAAVSAISPDTFRSMGWRVVAGRGIEPSDRWGARHVAVVNQALATYRLPGIVGGQIRIGDGPDDPWYTVVGVVKDAWGSGFGAQRGPLYAVYLSALQRPPRVAELVVRTRPQVASAAVDSIVRASFGGSWSVTRRGTEASVTAAEIAPSRWFGRMLFGQGIAAFAIAVLGTFAVMRMWVRAALPELAVRRAVGARRRHVIGFVLARAVAVAIAGVLLGRWLGLVVSGLLPTVLTGVPPARIVEPALALLVAALSGALLPAFQAARTSPALLAAGGEV